MTRSQTHQEIRQTCWCAGAWWYKTPSPTSLRAWTLFSWTPVKVHIALIRGFVWMPSGIPSPSQKSCLCHISRYSVQNPFVVCTWTEESPLLPNLTSTPAQTAWVHVIPPPFSRTFESPASQPRSNAESTRYRKQAKLPGCVKVRVTG